MNLPTNNVTLAAYSAIIDERRRQDTLHPKWHGSQHGLSVLVEEVGEVARGLYEWNNATRAKDQQKWRENLQSELVQVAAVCVRWLENLEAEARKNEHASHRA